MTQDIQQDLFLLIPVITSSLVVLGGLIKVLRTVRESKEEFKETKEAIYQDVDRGKKIDHILTHNMDIDAIPSIIEMQKMFGEYATRDYQKLKDHEARIESNARQVANLKEPMILLLQANLSTMESLKEKGFNHTTEESIQAIRKFLLDYYKK